MIIVSEAKEKKTLVDKAIPYWVWFILGFGCLSVIFSMGNYAINFITLLTVKGIYIPLWAIMGLIVVMIGICMFVGWVFETYQIWDRITSHQNRNMNPEIRGIYDKVTSLEKDIKEIKKALGINKEE